MDSTALVRIDSAFVRYLRGEDPGEVPDIARPVMMPAFRNFMRSLAAYDPSEEARRFAGRLLIVQGTTDVQVTMQDAELIHAAQPASTLLRLEGVNHALKFVESVQLAAQLKTYHDPSLPLAESLVPALARGIEALRGHATHEEGTWGRAEACHPGSGLAPPSGPPMSWP